MSSSPTHPLPTDSPVRGEGQSGGGQSGPDGAVAIGTGAVRTAADRTGTGGIGAGRTCEGEPQRWRIVAIGSCVLAAVLLTIVFWQPLWTGGGLVGSDVYAYFLPQKAYFADSLRSGTLPFWNNLVGHGYPQVAESQTGVFYPLHWVLYPLLSLNGAFSASIVAHYVLAFLFTFLYARRIGLSYLGAGLAALVYTYGWFPPRVCLEWSITGGAWLPLALWCADSFLQIRYWRYALLLTFVLAMQMLAGHFVMAFVTQLTLVLYVPLRLWFAAGDLPGDTLFPAAAGDTNPKRERGSPADASLALRVSMPGLATDKTSRWKACGGLALAATAAFFVAAVQLLPTWELKGLSQRQSVTAEHDPGYGYIPPLYLTQIALPWIWYSDESSINLVTTPGGSRTNRVEAHLYFGLIPLGLLLYGTWRSRKTLDRRLAVWMILGLAALIYTTGWLLPVTKHLPGFSFFEGPGRFGVVTTLAAGLVAGAGFAEVVRSSPNTARRLLAMVMPGAARRFSPGMGMAARCLVVAAVFSGTVVDLFAVSRQVTFAVLVQDPPANHLAESPLRRYFAGRSQPSRVFSEAKNLPSLLEVATVPTYLGLGPAQYYDPQFALPNPLPYAILPTREQLAWFHRAGVTHFLSFSPSDELAWSARLVWQGADLFLNRALGRPRDEKFYLYELSGGRGRVAWERAEPGQQATVTEYRPNRVAITADSMAGGKLVLTDLAYPGWEVSVDGAPQQPLVVDKMFRGAELSPGKHAVIWTYRPADVYWGAGISISMVLILMAVAHVRYWYPRLFERVFERKQSRTG